MMHFDIYFHENPFVALTILVIVNTMSILGNFIPCLNLHLIAQGFIYFGQFGASAMTIYVGYQTVKKIKERK